MSSLIDELEHGIRLSILQDLLTAVRKMERPDRYMDARLMTLFYVRDRRHVGEMEGWAGEPDSYAAVKSDVWIDPTTNAFVGTVPFRYTASLDRLTQLVSKVLPGWSWRVATCCVSDDAWVQPDFNCPVHGERLKARLDEQADWVALTDVDRRPAGQPALAFVEAMLRGMIANRDITLAKYCR